MSYEKIINWTAMPSRFFEKKKIKKIVLLMEFFFRMSAPEEPQCECSQRPFLREGWEGTAILSHGAVIRFGCISFTFSIVDYDSGIED